MYDCERQISLEGEFVARRYCEMVNSHLHTILVLVVLLSIVFQRMYSFVHFLGI